MDYPKWHPVRPRGRSGNRRRSPSREQNCKDFVATKAKKDSKQQIGYANMWLGPDYTKWNLPFTNSLLR